MLTKSIRRKILHTAILVTIIALFCSFSSCKARNDSLKSKIGITTNTTQTEQTSNETAEKISNLPLVDNDGHSPFVPVIRKVIPAVVFIKVTGVETVQSMFPGFPQFRFDPFSGGGDDMDFFNPFGGGQGQQPRQMQRVIRGQGSGFIIDKEGYIVTNNHVIDKAKQINVTLSDKRTFTAKVIGQDAYTDLALIKIDPKGADLPYIQFGDSDNIEVGDWAVAVGNPMGLENSVTIGVISAKGRSHLNIGGGGPVYQNFIQTDASINVGNSGGPLVNIKGEVIGINAAMNAMGQNLGFAIPSNLAKNIIKQLKEKGKVTRGYIGVYIADLTPEVAQSLGIPVKEGVLVNSVTPGGPAEKAGLLKGDVIIKADGKDVKDANTLMLQIGDIGADHEISLTYYRGSKQMDTKIKLLPRPEDLGKDTKSKGGKIGDQKNNEDAFGIKVIDISHPSLSRYKFPVSQGVVIMNIDEMSPASGVLTRGDVITEINRTPVNNTNDFKKIMDGLSGKKNPVVLYIYRENNGVYLSFTP